MIEPRFMRALVLAFVILGALAAPQLAESRNRDAEALANVILERVRGSLPPTASRSVDEQQGRVRRFADIVMTVPMHPVDPAAVQGAAIASIDAAAGPAATAESLVHAAVVGVSDFVTTGKLPPPACTHCERAPRKEAVPSGRQAGTIWLISMPWLPRLHLPEERDQCLKLAHDFEFPTDGISALVLDLRGNQGGYLPVATCVASQFLKPKTPLFRLRDKSGRTEVLEADVTGHSPITLPLAVFVDKGTESGALAIAAALQDAKRARLIGESKQQATANLVATFTVLGDRDMFFLPVGEIERLNGVRLAEGIQVDVAVSPADDDALIAAACAQFTGCSPAVSAAPPLNLPQ